MRASRAALQAAKAAMSFGPPTATSAALLAARDAPKRRVLLCANSTVHGGCVHGAALSAACCVAHHCARASLPRRRTYLGHCGELVTSFLNEAGAKKVLFVPWALKDWDKYFANPATIEYDATGQPKDHTGRPQARAAAAARPHGAARYAGKRITRV